MLPAPLLAPLPAPLLDPLPAPLLDPLPAPTHPRAQLAFVLEVEDAAALSYIGPRPAAWGVGGETSRTSY